MSELVRPTPLRDQLSKIITQRIHSGELEPGSKISLNELADELGVSRTPVREALLQLRAEKLVTRRTGKGYYVAPLVAEEAREIYEAIGAVESSGLRLYGSPPAALFEELDELTRARYAARDDALRNLELDARWHELILRHVENELLHEILEQLRNRMQRYEVTYMYSPDRIDVAARDHLEITEALREDRVEEAAKILQTHWSRAATLLSAEYTSKRTDGRSPPGG